MLKEPEMNMIDENDDTLADGEEGEKPKVKFGISFSKKFALVTLIAYFFKEEKKSS